ncbi:hypothetical protein Tco_0086793 [Tanacetum coccineum]
MEEYIRLEEEKAQRRGKVFNWETAKYGKIRVDEDVHNHRSIETKFPAITFTDEISSKNTLSCEPTVSSLNNEVDFRISFDDSDDEDHTYTNADIIDFKERLGRKYSREIHRVQVVDFQGMPKLMRDALGPLVWELILEFLSTLRFREVLLDLDALDTIHESKRMIPGKGDLHDYWRDISTDEDFLGPPLSYTLIRDLVLRLCHRMIGHSIAGRSQALEKVTVTDLFYLRGLDVKSINIC